MGAGGAVLLHSGADVAYDDSCPFEVDVDSTGGLFGYVPLQNE